MRVENSVDPDQMALSEASWSGSLVFSKKDKAVLSMRRVMFDIESETWSTVRQLDRKPKL